MKNGVLQIIIGSLVIVVWYGVSEFSGINKLLVPNPLDVFHSLVAAFSEDKIFIDLLATAKRVFVGFVGGTFTGVALGMVIGYYRNVEKALNFWIDFLRSIPAPTLIPVFLLLVGLGDVSKILFTTFVVGLIVLVNTVHGVKNANLTRIMTGKSMGMNNRQIFLYILFPEMLPYVSAGIRVALSFSIVAVIVSEMLMSTQYGFGRKIIDYQLVYELSKMYAVILITGVLGYGINKMYLLFENKKIHWVGK
jgi:ABC-type nitrate/sulfonate/bicarbonate transport system permease component